MGDYTIQVIGGVGQKLGHFMIESDSPPTAGSTLITDSDQTPLNCNVWAVFEWDHTVDTAWAVPWTLTPAAPVHVKVIGS